VITPELIEKSKQERLKTEENKKEIILGDESEEEDHEDFSDDEVSKFQPSTNLGESMSATFGEFEEKKEQKLPIEKVIKNDDSV